MDFQPLSKRLNVNIARKRGRGKHTYRIVAISHLYAPSSPSKTPPQVHGDIIQVTWETDRHTDVVQWADGWSAVSVWRHHRDLMCSKLQVEVGFLGNLWGPGMAGDHARTWRKKGLLGRGEQPLQLSREYPAGRRLIYQAFRSELDFGWRRVFGQSSHSLFFSRPVRRQFSSVCFLFFCWLFFSCNMWMLGFLCPWILCFTVGCCLLLETRFLLY